MGSVNQPRDQRGRWAAGGSGSESGDHQSESPSLTHRVVNGVSIPRSVPVVRLDNEGSPQPKTGYFAKALPKYANNMEAARTAEGGRLNRAAGERIRMRKDADRYRYR